MPTHAHRLLWGTYTIPAFPPEKFFDDPVLQRMEGNHSQPSTWNQRFDSLGQYTLNSFQFAIHGDTQSLKGTSSRVKPRLAMHDPFNYTGKLPRGVEWAAMDDSACNPAGLALLTIAVDQGGQFMLRQGVDQISGGGHSGSGGVKTHVQRGIFSKREPASGRIQLDRGNAEVEDDAIHCLPSLPDQLVSPSVNRRPRRGLRWEARGQPMLAARAANRSHRRPTAATTSPRTSSADGSPPLGTRVLGRVTGVEPLPDGPAGGTEVGCGAALGPGPVWPVAGGGTSVTVVPGPKSTLLPIM